MAFGDDQPLAAPDAVEIRPETGLQLAGSNMQDTGHVVIVTTSAPDVKRGVREVPQSCFRTVASVTGMMAVTVLASDRIGTPGSI